MTQRPFMHCVPIKNLIIGPGQPLTMMCGPCVIESEEMCLQTAAVLKELFVKHDVGLIFKSSYDKANRSSYHSFRGPGLQEGLRILQKVQQEFDVPVVTDIHSPQEAQAVGQVCDVIQIPAFLCRQTDLIIAAAQTGAVVSVKKGQFLAPWDMENVVYKITSAQNQRIILIDRGTSFGYNQLISDMRCIPIMQGLGYPVFYDGTHSVQKPGALGTTTGGDRCYIPPLAKAALAAGANGLFLEAHLDPENAKSDASNVIDIKQLAYLLPQFKELYQLIQQQCQEPIH